MMSLSEWISDWRPSICSWRDSRRNFFRRRDRLACSRLRSRLSFLCDSVSEAAGNREPEGAPLAPEERTEEGTGTRELG